MHRDTKSSEVLSVEGGCPVTKIAGSDDSRIWTRTTLSNATKGRRKKPSWCRNNSGSRVSADDDNDDDNNNDHNEGSSLYDFFILLQK